MGRYKGRLSARNIERTYPHIVEMAVPERGFLRKSDDMTEWHRKRGLQSQGGQGLYREPVWYVRWCFLDRNDAEAFRVEFGGQLLPATRPQKRGRG